jgi:hypothetical protein
VSEVVRPPKAGGVDRGLLLLSGIVFIAFGLFQAAPRFAARLDYSRLEKEGVVVEGTVTGKRRTKNSWYVNYSFVTRDNRFIEGSDRRGGDDWMKLQFAGPVTVAYLPSRPETNRILPPAFVDVQYNLGIVGAGLVLLLMAAFRWPRRVFVPSAGSRRRPSGRRSAGSG